MQVLVVENMNRCLERDVPHAEDVSRMHTAQTFWVIVLACVVVFISRAGHMSLAGCGVESAAVEQRATVEAMVAIHHAQRRATVARCHSVAGGDIYLTDGHAGSSSSLAQRCVHHQYHQH
jgi:hypothetical protein